MSILDHSRRIAFTIASDTLSLSPVYTKSFYYGRLHALSFAFPKGLPQDPQSVRDRCNKPWKRHSLFLTAETIVSCIEHKHHQTKQLVKCGCQKYWTIWQMRRQEEFKKSQWMICMHSLNPRSSDESYRTHSRNLLRSQARHRKTYTGCGRLSLMEDI